MFVWTTAFRPTGSGMVAGLFGSGPVHLPRVTTSTNAGMLKRIHPSVDLQGAVPRAVLWLVTVDCQMGK